MTSKNFNFKKGNPYASKDEYAAAQAEQARVDAEYADSVSIDGHAPKIVEFGPVNDAARSAGIVARLGNVGVSASQKAAIEAKMGR